MFAERDNRQVAHLSSCSDYFPMVHQRHPVVEATLGAQLSGNHEKRFSRQRGKQSTSWQLQGLNLRRGRPSHVESRQERTRRP